MTLDQAGTETAERIDVRLVAIRWLAEDIHAFELMRPDGKSLPPAEAGAHIDIELPNGMTRQYSLVNADAATDRYILGIKNDPASRGGSRSMFEELRVGQTLTISAPRNNFPLAPGATHHVLIAGGIGITPIYAMVQKLRDTGASFELHYAARSRGQLAFLEDLGSDPSSHIHADDENDGALLDIAAIVAAAPDGSHFYCCGPTPMIESFTQATRDIDNTRLHLEHFTPVAEADTSGGFIVELARSGKQIAIPEGRTILETLRDAGLDLPSSCEEGVCGTCETRVISGIPDHRDSILFDDERAANNVMMICCSGSKSDKLVLDL